VKDICSNKRPDPLQRVCDYKTAKIGWVRTTGPKKLKFTCKLLRTTLPEKFKFLYKLPVIVKNQNSERFDPRG
jgi:hypothetical protein